MHSRLGTKEESSMLNTFLTKASKPASVNSLPLGPIQQGLSLTGRERLRADLELLIKTGHLPKGFPSKARVLVVEGEEDSIVIPSARQYLIEELLSHLEVPPTHWVLPGMGHTLLAPELSRRVLNWLEESL